MGRRRPRPVDQRAGTAAAAGDGTCSPRAPPLAEGELPEDAEPVPGEDGYHQASTYSTTVVYSPDNERIGSVENQAFGKGSHRTSYGDRSIPGRRSVAESIRHLVEVHRVLTGPASEVSHSGVWIEHAREHTRVWGVAPDDRELLLSLEVAGGPRGFTARTVERAQVASGLYCHALPTHWTHKTRSNAVSVLKVLMASRGFDLPVHDSQDAREAAAAGTAQGADNRGLRFTSVPEIEPGEPFTSSQQVQDLLRTIERLYNQGVRHNNAWRRMTSGTADGRPDALRLKHALSSIQEGRLFGAPQPMTLARTAELLRVATAVAERLRSEKTPTLQAQIAELAQHALSLAERTVATAGRPGAWPPVFKAPVAEDAPVGEYQQARALAWAQWWAVVSSGFAIASGEVGQAATALEHVMLHELPEDVVDTEEATRRLVRLSEVARALQELLAQHPKESHPEVESAVASIRAAATQHAVPAPEPERSAPAQTPVSHLTGTTSQPAVATDAAAPGEMPSSPADDTQDTGGTEHGTTGQHKAEVPVGDPDAKQRWEEANPRPSTRLSVSREGTNVIVAGTRGDGEDLALREWLKSKHLSFIKETGRWESNYGNWRTAPKTAIFAARLEKEVNAYIKAMDAAWRDDRDNIGRTLTLELRAAYETKAAAAESYPLTTQQRDIVVAAQDGLNVAVQALAGTGKTSTMVAMARRMPNRRITYLAFNSANAVDARQKFAGLRHVSVSTAHSLAARDLMVTALSAKVTEGQQDGGIGSNAEADWAEYLKVQPVLARDRGEDISAEDIVVLIKETIRSFRNSDADTIDLSHVPEGDHPLLEIAARPTALRNTVLAHAQAAWRDKIDPNSRELNFHHDDYLKIWALSRPKVHADTIVFDEAQDINPVLRKVVLDNMRPTVGHAAQVVIVGDPNQSIYGFRGAENALEDWPSDVELPLNKSWRFGPEVADIANIFLKLLGSPYLMEGNDAVSTAIGPIDVPDAVLGRTNAGVVAAVLAALNDGRKVHMVGGGDELKRMAEGAKELQQKGKTRKHPDLVPFRSWEAVRRYVDKHDSAKQLEAFVRLVDEHGADALIEMVGKLTKDAADADLIVSTAHKSKGLEWAKVQVGTDFRGPKTSTEPGQDVVLPTPEDLRLAYVTATRGKRGLDLGSLAYIEELRSLADDRYLAPETNHAPKPPHRPVLRPSLLLCRRPAPPPHPHLPSDRQRPNPRTPSPRRTALGRRSSPPSAPSSQRTTAAQTSSSRSRSLVPQRLPRPSP